MLFLDLVTCFQVLNKEFYSLQASTDKRINELQSNITDAMKKLSIYEKLEQELDDVILQAAQCTYSGDSLVLHSAFVLHIYIS